MTKQYVTVARAQQNKALENVSSAILTNWIQAASEMICLYCDNDFTQQYYTDVLDGNGLSEIMVRQTGITALTSCTILDGTTTTTIDTTDLDFDASTARVGFAEDSTASYTWFPKGFQNITIVYTAGSDPIPQDVQEATVQIVYNMSKPNNLTMTPGLQSERMGEYQRTKDNSVNGEVFDMKVKDMLAGRVRYEF